jgi:hypothetical protein
MKKVLFLIMMVLVLAGCLVSTPSTQSARESSEKTQGEAAITALSAIPIPVISYFQERRTVAKWAERWDKPGVATYVYLFSFGNVIGYYVADGKPASTRSYLMPEETLVRGEYGEGWGDFIVSAPDIDGTYGENNPGIRFFTAEGTAVEWGGSGASYLYSDAPLPLNAPRLNVSRN